MNKKKILLVAALILVAGVAVYYLLRPTPTTTPTPGNTAETNTYNPPTDQEKQEVEKNKTSPGANSQPTNGSQDKKVVITDAYQNYSDKKIVIKTALYGNGWRSCTLTATQGNESFSKQADTLYQSSFSTCLGFSISTSDFPSAGTWTFKLSVTNSDGKTYTSQTKSVNVIK